MEFWIGWLLRCVASRSRQRCQTPKPHSRRTDRASCTRWRSKLPVADLTAAVGEHRRAFALKTRPENGELLRFWIAPPDLRDPVYK